MSAKSDKELVEAARGGDVDGFTALCERYYPAMVAIAHAVLGDRHLAEDAAQEGFAKACQRLRQLKNGDRVAGWLAAICRNAAKDLARAGEKLRTAEDLSKLADASERDAPNEAVREAIRTLPASARELIYLRYYDGMTYEQIAAVLEISEQAINGRLRRAKKRIARTLRRSGFIEV